MINKSERHKKTKANALKTKKVLVILGSMVERSIKTQYRRSVLGVFWTVLNPFLTMLVIAFVFSAIFKRNIAMDYPVYVLSGNIVFNLMRMATSESLTSIVDNYDLLTKTRVPQAAFPISKNLSAAVNFGFSLIALIIVMLFRIPYGVRFHWTMFMIVPFLPSIMLFSIGLSLILCSIYVRFRDIKHIYSVFLTLWMYLTPLFYSVDLLPPDVVKFINFNPMYHYVTYFRDIITGTVPSALTHLIIYGIGIFCFGVGWLVFSLSKKKFILYI